MCIFSLQGASDETGKGGRPEAQKASCMDFPLCSLHRGGSKPGIPPQAIDAKVS